MFPIVLSMVTQGKTHGSASSMILSGGNEVAGLSAATSTAAAVRSLDFFHSRKYVILGVENLDISLAICFRYSDCPEVKPFNS